EDPEESQDWLPLLDAEIQGLPENLRVPLILCDLQGRSRAETASLLGLNEGTLSSRLARARDRLHQRLSKKGWLTGAGLASAFAYSSDAVPSGLVTATATAATTGAASASVASITQGVLKAMLYTKLKIGFVVVLTLAIGSGALIGAHYVGRPDEA